MPVIEYQNISFAYPNGTEALFEVSLSIEEGEILAIVGQNGGGKTTLVKMTNGLLHPSQGKVLLYGKDIAGTSTAKISKTVGFVFQNPRTQLFLNSVEGEVAFGPKQLKMSDADVKRRVDEALLQVGLQDKRTSHPYDLTAPERKLLTIASIISMDPKILILDEPSGGMDAVSLEIVANVINNYRHLKRTVITISHDMDFVARCFERVVVLKYGRIVRDGLLHDVFADHALLEETSLEPTAISKLAANCGLQKELITVEEMVASLKTTHFLQAN